MQKVALRAALLLLAGAAAQAGGLAQLKVFVDTTQAFQAEFSQTVSQPGGKKPQTASGVVAIQRPGKFNWRYQQPYDQRVVGDGKKVWIYDPDLNQVTVKRLDQALGSSPAALLAGSNDLERAYRLSEQAGRDGLEWVEASPRSRDNTFEKVRMGFRDNQLVQMELNDNFGQTTRIRFDKVVRNPRLDPTQFNFAPPPDADVVSADQQ
ncbi:outer membrane lipoprotein chaperone LolA [Chitinimonas lacunae]|uniref:Outer-membrane lipoprotein carrier protein n=1 Tax=Chitinimonas lacunae TaxID=1963018 RepID=A0ABV8MVX2_9NEIS